MNFSPWEAPRLPSVRPGRTCTLLILPGGVEPFHDSGHVFGLESGFGPGDIDPALFEPGDDGRRVGVPGGPSLFMTGITCMIRDCCCGCSEEQGI
jgi:hypothetical protein